jgi:hypothetical protein
MPSGLGAGGSDLTATSFAFDDTRRTLRLGEIVLP